MSQSAPSRRRLLPAWLSGTALLPLAASAGGLPHIPPPAAGPHDFDCFVGDRHPGACAPAPPEA